MGGAGHSSEILKRLSNKGKLYCFDQDDYAIKKGNERLSKIGTNYQIIKSNFYNIKQELSALGVDKVDGILYDLGVSSFQFDIGERGFSYHIEGDLDMRMDTNQYLKAYDIVNFYTFEELKNIFFKYGEEKYSGLIAKKIVKEREKEPIERTVRLAQIIANSVPAAARRDGHPARKCFQALRIAVNGELDVLKSVLDDAFDLLNKDGVLAIITFHSLEDLMVKHKFKEFTVGCTCPPDIPVCVCGKTPRGKVIHKKGIDPSSEELKENQRSRSAKLRTIIKL
jgi:16S rRNA (cytosine1402-N4)-methyltransferase